MKVAVIINGLGSAIDEKHLMVRAMKNWGYEVEIVNVLDEKININQIKLKKEPTIIIGWSLGGLVVQGLASKYPQAKIVLVATGNRIGPKKMILKLAFGMVKKEWGLRLARKILNWPVEALIDLYIFFMAEGYDSGETKISIKKNVEYFRKISLLKWREVIEYMKKNNKKMLKNKTLIISGRQDWLMPVYLGEELNREIKGSRLVVNDGAHFNVLNEESLEVIKNFL